MTATAEPLVDKGPCGWCSDGQWDHRQGKKGCKVPGCGCGKYEPPKDRPAPAVEESVVAAALGEMHLGRTAHPTLAEVEAEPEPVDEPEPTPVPVVADPAAQAEVQDLTDIIDAQLRPVVELMEADQPAEQPEPPAVDAQRVADVAAHVDARRVEQLLGVDAELARAQTEIDRLNGQLTARLTDLDDARREAAEAHNKAARLRMERDRAEKARQKTAQLLDETAAALAEERTEHQATAAIVTRLRDELDRVNAGRQRAEDQLDEAIRAGVSAATNVLWRYDARQCETCGRRYTVDVDHEHPLTPVTVLVVRREVPGA